MSFIGILCVLILEQIRAAPAAWIASLQTGYGAFLDRQFNGGERKHGMTAWFAGVLLPVLALLLMQLLLDYFLPPLRLVLDVAVLYFVMGFRQFSRHFTNIQLALRMGELDRARSLLAEWRGSGAERLGAAEVARLAIEQGIVSSHRHVFAPLLWFIALGPAGALLYRLSSGLAQQWAATPSAAGLPGVEASRFGEFPREVFRLIDWLPARMTAMTFAIVGDFEDAVYCWRTQAGLWPDDASGILLSSGAGALGIRLGLPLPDATGFEARPELGIGDDADIEHLQSAIGLVWRALVLCLLLLALMTLASWVG